MPASVPPATMTSASPRRMISLDSPRAWPPVAQADTVAKFGPGHPEVDGDLAGADVGDAHRDEERADPVRAAQGVGGDPVDERPDAAEAGPEDDPGPLGELALEPLGQAGLVERLAGGDQAELDVAVGAALLLAVEHAARVEVADLAGDPRRQPRRVEGRDRADAGAPGDQARPGGGDVVAEGGDHAHAGHDDATRARSSDELPGADRRGPVDVARQAARGDRVGDREHVELGPPDLGRDLAVVDVDERPRRGRVAVEDVAGRARVDDELPAQVADLGQVGVAAGDDPGIGARRRARR